MLSLFESLFLCVCEVTSAASMIHRLRRLVSVALALWLTVLYMAGIARVI